MEKRNFASMSEGPISAKNLDEILKSPGGQSVSGKRNGQFWTVTAFDAGSTWVGKWRGESLWERHAQGDELLHVLQGEVEVTLLLSGEKASTLVSQGSVFVVPRNHWHKQIARTEVVVFGVTPGSTEHSADEPTR